MEAPVTPFPHISSTNYQHYGHLLKNIENIIDQCDHPAFYQKKIKPSRKMARAQMRPWQVTPQSFLSEVFHSISTAIHSISTVQAQILRNMMLN